MEWNGNVRQTLTPFIIGIVRQPSVVATGERQAAPWYRHCPPCRMTLGFSYFPRPRDRHSANQNSCFLGGYMGE